MSGSGEENRPVMFREADEMPRDMEQMFESGAAAAGVLMRHGIGKVESAASVCIFSLWFGIVGIGMMRAALAVNPDIDPTKDPPPDIPLAAMESDVRFFCQLANQITSHYGLGEHYRG